MSSLTRNKLAKIQMRQIFLLFFFGCHSFHHPSPLLYLFDCVCSRKHVKECLCKFTIDTGVKDSFWRTLLPPSFLLSFIYKSSLCCNISSTSPSPPLLILTLHEILLSNALYPWPSLPCRAVIMCSVTWVTHSLLSVSPWILCSLTFKYIQIEIIPANGRPCPCMWFVLWNPPAPPIVRNTSTSTAGVLNWEQKKNQIAIYTTFYEARSKFPTFILPRNSYSSSSRLFDGSV